MPSAPAATTTPNHADASLFSWPVRVYWEDTDAGGIVFYANYLKYFERARTEWLRALGVQQQQLREDSGLIFVVTDTAVRYLAPARLDDHIAVTVQLVQASRVRLTLDQVAWCDGRRLAEGRIRIACVDAQQLRPGAMPRELLATLSALVTPAAARPPELVPLHPSTPTPAARTSTHP
ncbi:MAG: tol-pal system-associated acyl-CoA thioesterase [Pseudomonadota bacterium]|jgi:acyl-CoA thioester hydrolase